MWESIFNYFKYKNYIFSEKRSIKSILIKWSKGEFFLQENKRIESHDRINIENRCRSLIFFTLITFLFHVIKRLYFSTSVWKSSFRKLKGFQTQIILNNQQKEIIFKRSILCTRWICFSYHLGSPIESTFNARKFKSISIWKNPPNVLL